MAIVSWLPKMIINTNNVSAGTVSFLFARCRYLLRFALISLINWGKGKMGWESMGVTPSSPMEANNGARDGVYAAQMKAPEGNDRQTL